LAVSPPPRKHPIAIYKFNRGFITSNANLGFATATQTPYSDIDIAIVKREDFLKHFRAYDYFEMRNELRNTLMKKFHRNVDIFDMDSTSPLKEDIQKEAIYV
jgi:predicted nucleotidyltransferase